MRYVRVRDIDMHFMLGANVVFRMVFVLKVTILIAIICPFYVRTSAVGCDPYSVKHISLTIFIIIYILI